MRATRRLVLSITAIAFSLLAHASPIVPPEVHKLVFSGGRFTAPITMDIPSDAADRQSLQVLRSGKYSGMYIVRNPAIVHIDKSLLSYLVGRGLATVEVANFTNTVSRTQAYPFLVVDTEKLNREPGVAKRITTIPAPPDYTIAVARRALASITYANQYQAAPLGVSIKVCALTFSYRVVPSLSGVPPVTKLYEGKAKAYLNPDDGKWTLDSLDLERDDADIQAAIQTRFPAYSFKASPAAKQMGGVPAKQPPTPAPDQAVVIGTVSQVGHDVLVTDAGEQIDFTGHTEGGIPFYGVGHNGDVSWDVKVGDRIKIVGTKDGKLILGDYITILSRK